MQVGSSLSIGNYKLTVSMNGFKSNVVSPVTVDASRTTDITAKLTVGSVSETVQVEGQPAVVETTSNAITTTVDMKQIETLPLVGRDLTQLSRLAPGYSGSGTTGTWNGLPAIAQGNNVDGVIGSPSRMKFSGNAQAAVSPRLEDIAEMTVQTDELDMNQGFGQAAMQINYVTRRGTNAFHGRLFEDFRNSALNANSWRNGATGVKKPHHELNDFGGSFGGPIFKDKLFFFAGLATSRQPGSVPAINTVLTADAQNGFYSYVGTDGQTHRVNLFQAVQAYNASLPGSVNSVTAGQLAAVNKSLQSGTISTTSDPIINNINWLTPHPTTFWYPTIRLDYNTSKNIRMNLAINRTIQNVTGATTPFFPGSDFAKTGGSNKFDDITASYGLDWTISPTLVNQFRGGYLYNVSRFTYDSPKAYINNPIEVSWLVQPGSNPAAPGSPMNYTLPVTSFYPVVNFSDTMNWQHANHNISYGFSFYREQDHYWNPPEGIASMNLGLVNGDPALNALTNAGSYRPLRAANATQQAEAQNLYAVLTGRISGVGGRYRYDPASGKYPQEVGAFNLDELSKAWGLFAQDSWRVRPSLTVNYGIRWDLTGAQHDLTGAYHNASVTSLYSPSGVGNLFKPGTLSGTATPTLDARPNPYNAWNVAPQPAIGVAWNPNLGGGLLGKLTGHGGTVIRAGFSLRRFTVPYQYFWDDASDYGSFFHQFFNLNPTTSPGAPGTFAPGTLSLGQSLPPYSLGSSDWE